MKYQYTIQIAITKNSGITKSCKGCRDTNHLHVLVRMQNIIFILENSWANLLKTKYVATSNSTNGYFPHAQRNRTLCSHKNLYIIRKRTYNSQKLESAQTSPTVEC